MKTDSFHHGNLRAELLKAAMNILSEKGVEGISLRNIAQNLNVSPGAPYRHFKSKDELILSLAKEGFAKLTTEFEEAKLSNGSDEECLSKVCMSYLICAEESPHLFKLLLSSEYNIPYIVDEETGTKPNDPHKEFEALIKKVITVEMTEAKSKELTTACWALLHGFATLHMSGRLETTQYKKEHAIKAVIALAKSSYYS